MTDLRVQVGSPNGDGKRPVVYRLGDQEYPDTVDVSSGWQREQSLKRGLEALGIPTDNLPSLGAEVVRLASEADKKANSKENQKERFPIVSSSALDSADYTPRPIVTEALFAGVPGIIGAPFKTCKSLVGIDAAISIATGRPFLGSFTVPEPMTVLYSAGEGGPCVSQDYGRRIAASKGIKLSDATQLHWCFSVPRLEDLRDLDESVKVLDNTGAEVWFVDNLMLAMSGDDAGNVYKMGGILGNVIRLCSERSVTPVFIHHFKRTRSTADPFAPGELSDLTQAGAAEIAGQWWLLTRRQAYSPEYPGEHRLWLSVGGRVGHSSLHALDIHEGQRTDPGGRRWDVQVFSPDAVRDEREESREQAKAAKVQASLERDADKVLRVLAKTPDGATKNTIRERAGLSGGRVGTAVAWLLDENHIAETTIQVSNHRTPLAGYKLAESRDA